MAKKTYPPLAALQKARNYCAYQERCQQEVRNKLLSYGLENDTVESHLAALISEGYINEERFARAFAGGKFRIKKWGKKRIEMELKRRDISPACIRTALKEIVEPEYEKTLRILAKKLEALTRGRTETERRQKIYKKLLSKGYEATQISRILKVDFD